MITGHTPTFRLMKSSSDGKKFTAKYRVRHWIEGYEKSDGKAGRDFDKEEVV